MKKINFEELMASVSEQFVEEAASFSPIKAFNTRFVALAACIAIIVTAIPAVVILNREKDVDAPKVTTPVENIVVTPGGENEKIEPLNVIYCNAETLAQKEDFINNALINKDVEIKGFVKYNSVLMNEYQKIENVSGIPKTLKFTMGNKVYDCTFEYAYNTKAILSTNETLKSYAKIAKYSIDGMSIGKFKSSVYYCVETNEIICAYLAGDIGTQLEFVKGNLTEEEIKTIATNDLINLYGEKTISRYDIEVKKLEYKVYGSEAERYFLRFTRKIGDFITSEEITMYYNTAGEFIEFKSENLHVFDLVENTLNEKVLLKFESNALEIYDGKLVESKRLEMGNDGVPYMYTCLKYVDGDKLKLYELHYKINIK